MPSLFAASGARIELEVRRSYVLGRGLDCDVVVEDMAASRRHARLSLGVLPELIWLHDLNSRNGTYVNEVRINGVTPVAPGYPASRHAFTRGRIWLTSGNS